MNSGSESTSHKKLKNTIKRILERCGFIVDSELQLDINANGKPERSFDVCALFELGGHHYMLVFECRDQEIIRGINRELSAWEKDIESILQNRENITVLSSLDKKILSNHIRKVEKIKLAFAFTEKLDESKFKYQRIRLDEKSIIFWDHKAVKYFDKTSSTLGEWMKYEIYRELNISEDLPNIHQERAVVIRQPGFPEMYLLGMHPGLLLRIGYVLRRSSNKPYAYQRAINKDRIEKISKFLESKDAFLPNSIIIAFDNDPNVQRYISYDGNGILKFPIMYCSAWIIDGQHRVYGFIRTRYKDWSDQRNEEFKLPVVAFKTLREDVQNKTFVNINYYQKKINPTLFCDLATVSKDLSNELTWPSLLVSELNKTEPWKDNIMISEFDTRKPITLSSFSRYALLETLLGYNKKSGNYDGPLFKYAPFHIDKPFDDINNQNAFSKQLDLLIRYFTAIRKKTFNSVKDQNVWGNFRKYALTKTTGVNALLLVLAKILEKHPDGKVDFDIYLDPIRQVDFKVETVVKFGGGWVGFRNLANHIIRKLRKHNNENLRIFGKRKKR